MVVRVAESGTYGFIRTELGDDLFFHQSAAVSRSHCLYMAIGVGVTFQVGSNAKGYCAEEVRLNFSRDVNELVGKSGSVLAYVGDYRDGTDHSVGIVPEYGEILLRKGVSVEEKEWNALREGDGVRLAAKKSKEGVFGVVSEIVPRG